MESWKKTFAVIWSGQLASILSSEVVAYSIIFWMSLETGSAEVLALEAIAGMLPKSLLGPLVGVYDDRRDRKRALSFDANGDAVKSTAYIKQAIDGGFQFYKVQTAA